jgi:CelD/BcsL family acetyltransferase involved in cellulose biosynthesis
VAAVTDGVRVVVVEREGRCVGLLPLQSVKSAWSWLGLWEPVGGGMTDYFGLVSPADSTLKVSEILQRAGLGALFYSHLDATQASIFNVSSRAQSRIGLRIRLGDQAGAYWESLAQRDKKLVSDTARRDRKLQQEHGAVSFEYQSSQAPADLERLIVLKNAQYDRTGKAAPLQVDSNVALLRRILAVRDPACTPILSVLRVGDRVVAAHFGLRCHQTLHFWFPVYDADFKAYAPGRILLRRVIEAAWSDGVRLIDRGEGDTPAKRDFANEEHLFLTDVAAGPGWRGWAARAGFALHWRTTP